MYVNLFKQLQFWAFSPKHWDQFLTCTCTHTTQISVHLYWFLHFGLIIQWACSFCKNKYWTKKGYLDYSAIWPPSMGFICIKNCGFLNQREPKYLFSLFYLDLMSTERQSNVTAYDSIPSSHCNSTTLWIQTLVPLCLGLITTAVIFTNEIPAWHLKPFTNIMHQCLNISGTCVKKTYSKLMIIHAQIL